MLFHNIKGVPDFECHEYEEKKNKYCLCIPIINEKENIRLELHRARVNKVHTICDIIICDGGSTDGGTDEDMMCGLGVNTLLVKRGPGKQGAQLRMGFYWALKRGYEGIITIDGNNKDSIEDVVHFIEKHAVRRFPPFCSHAFPLFWEVNKVYSCSCLSRSSYIAFMVFTP
ncbi:MAG: hypothetical protein IJ339_01395, partial [Oscillospiraceae bacterium]|nr:hypothetical protein [Oscillospiraceae bacterium]